MKAHVRNTVRNVLRRDRSRSRSQAPMPSTSPQRHNDTSSSSRALDQEEDHSSSQPRQQRRSHHFPPFRSFSRAPSPPNGPTVRSSRTFRWGQNNNDLGSTYTSEETSVNSMHRRNSFFSSHRWKSQGRESETESTDHGSHHQRWSKRIFSRLRRNKSTASRGGVDDYASESERDPEISSSSWRARFSRRKSRSQYPQSNVINSQQVDFGQSSTFNNNSTEYSDYETQHQPNDQAYNASPFSPPRGTRTNVPPESRSSNSPASSHPEGNYSYPAAPACISPSFRTSNSSVYIRPSENMPATENYLDQEGPRYSDRAPSSSAPRQQQYPYSGSRSAVPTRKTYQYDASNYLQKPGTATQATSTTIPPTIVETTVADSHSFGGRELDESNLGQHRSSTRANTRHRVGSVVGTGALTQDSGPKKRYQAGWSPPQDTLTPGTESTRATELDSPYQDDPGISNETDRNALTYSPQESPASPVVVHIDRNKEDAHHSPSYYTQQRYEGTAPAPGNASARSKTELEHSWSEKSVLDISCPSWALSVHGTPVDLTHFFCPKAWTPERYKSLKRLAPAIHGEVRYVLDLLEKKSVVVKVIRNSAVRPRSPGELENPLVEIGAMTYLHSNKAVYPVDLVAKLGDVYQDSKYTYLVTEYCSEGELFREVVTRKCLSERHVKAIALQLTLALYSLHKNGICHRDVSLENTLLQSDRSIRLIDFGQAEAIHEPDGRPKYMTGSAGKAYYRAPEMLRGPYLGPPVDVFALGVEIFIMAVGSPPWQKASLQDARYRNLTKCSTALDVALRKWGKRAHLSDAFVDILASIFCSEPNMRPTVEDLLYHPWFAFDSGVWRWVYARGCSKTIRSHAERVEKYLRLHPQGKYFARPCVSSTVPNNTDGTPSEVQ